MPKVALVTGGGRGLGRELALSLAQVGYAVAVADLSMAGEETSAMIVTRGGEAVFCQADVSDLDQVRHLVEEVCSKLGPISLLVNNAIVSPVASVAEMSMAEWDRVMAVNLRGPVALTKEALPHLRRTSGTVVNILSGAAMGASALAFMSAYCASKAALSSFTIAFAQEEEVAGVMATAVWVGMTDTPGARESMAQLAPLIDTDFHDMVAALRPADQVATAITHMIENSIGEYHGTTVEDHILLEEAGLVELGAPEGESVEPHAGGGNLQELAVEVLQVVDENEAKLLDLPAFIRPLARRGFHSKSGKNFAGWRQLLEPVSQGESPSPELGTLIPGLIEYIQNSPREVAKFTRDQETIKQVTAIAQRQIAAIRAFQQALG